MTLFPQNLSVQPDLNDIQQRVFRRRQHYVHVLQLPQTLISVAATNVAYVGTIVSRIYTLPRRYVLHVVVSILVLLASVARIFPATHVLTEQSPLGRPMAILSDLVAPVFPVTTDHLYKGETPVPDTAFAVIDALPVMPAEPRLHGRFTTIAQTVTDGANARSGPGTNYDQLATLPAQTSVQVLARHGDWFQVRGSGGTIFWVAAELLNVNATAREILPVVTDIPPPPPPRIGVVNEAQLNLRDGPGTDYMGIVRLPVGVPLDLLAQYGDWMQVQTPEGHIGWVSTAYLTIEPGIIERVERITEIPDPRPNLVGTTVASRVNLRAGPGIGYSRIGILEAGMTLDLVSRYGDWFQIRTAQGTSGWVASELIEVSTYIARRVPQAQDIPPLPQPQPQSVQPIPIQPAQIPVQPAPVQPAPVQSAPVQSAPVQPAPAELAPMEVAPEQAAPAPFTIEETNRRPPIGRVAPSPHQPAPVDVAPAPVDVAPAPVDVVPEPGEEGAAPPPPEPTAAPVEPESPPLPAPPAITAHNVVDYALRFVGANYVWGGAGPGGFDCSGFTMYIYRQFGVSLPHSAAAQYSTRYGVIISNVAELQPGDLVFFANTYTSGISHVGLYIGDGNVVQALSPGLGVGVASLYSAYWSKHYYSALRPYR